jgi:16S rRNA processing protein RimM
MEKKLIAIGKVLGPFGLDGRVKVKNYSEIPGRFHNVKKVFLELDTGLRGFLIEEVEETDRGPVVLFKNITSRTDAERLTGAEVLVDFEDRIELPEDAYFIHDIIGAVVEDVKVGPLGIVDDVLTGAANDVLVVKDEKDREVLIPVVDEFILDMDIEQKRVKVRLIEGMIPES